MNNEKIIADINEKITEAVNRCEVAKISLPQISSQSRLSVLEAIHNVFQVERIGDNLLIKFDSGEKEEIHDALRSSLRGQFPNWWIQTRVTCSVNGNEYLPDVGAWRRRPSSKQRRFPVVYSCPPPLIWIEVVYNTANDRDRALGNIQLNKPYCHETEFVIVVLPYGKEFQQKNTNLGSDSVEVGAPLKSCPSRAPYIGYWPSHEPFNKVHWHKIVWNQHLSIGHNVCINFNDILNHLTSDESEVDDSEDDDEGDPCPYCEEVLPNVNEMVRHIKESHLKGNYSEEDEDNEY